MADAAERAIAHVRSRSAAPRSKDLERLADALDAQADESFVEEIALAVRSNCRLTLNFHPDRLMANRASVAEGLLRAGCYLPQSETGLSNGGRSAVPAGERTGWERLLFGAAYDQVDARRPCYGALDITGDPFGGSPRFGSSFIVLDAGCFDRATFVVGDSHMNPADVGTIDSFAAILAGLFESAARGDGLGRGLSTPDLLQALVADAPTATPARELDHYVETQLHGTISLLEDVSAMVLDPSFFDTPAHAALRAASAKYDFILAWHTGSSLAASQVPADFRGPTIPELAHRVAAENGTVNAAAIGRSASSIPFSPPTPAGDDADSALQQHKYLWHCLLKFGESAEPATPRAKNC